MSTSTFTIDNLAIFGGAPALAQRLALGQHNFPSWDRYEAAFRDIFARQYYTNHGPLAQALEARLQQRLNVRHAMCVTNATIGLALAAQALGLKGKVVVPAFSFVNTAQSLAWADVEVAFCDVSRATGHLSPETVEPLLTEGVSGILGVNLWGDAADVEALEHLAARHGVPLYFDTAHGFGCEIAGKPAGGFGRLEVISFHSSHILSATEGAVICTNDDDLAAHIRNIRSNYGMGRPVPVGKTGNGRLSEAQAAIALMNLDDLPELIARNRRVFNAYETLLADVPGLHLKKPQQVSASNYQNVVYEMDAREFGLSRDALIDVLRAENIEGGADRGLGTRCRDHGHSLPNTAHWCESVLQLPTGAQVDEAVVERIATVVRTAQRNAGRVAKALGA
ncbi:aminotransferase class I/II-fold pyridoxal phosphate-dependent enzyme [Paraburkholderia sp. Tr-20389]|uniref:aminotransferase class I/II-fold pyridoxal phosphate-dependent enzyme n=1 Tax=Paraburkholderia sp. Tr-20389 TaxID=2703903 RepID=UPI00197D073A|nr:aminotransferase class I/II-fold pyridoxal phosphate-dependent enzyme [Paraburkholderia sp. Tr-20389]MBN3752837.1 aminotransferase class I/II-fold pyridoxal phosphate-dependent enzyme [Paraburkholderia sp. Tr-20389]